MAAALVALRPALESLVIRASKDPEEITNQSPLDQKVVSVVRELCKVNAGRYNLEQVNMAG